MKKIIVILCLFCALFTQKTLADKPVYLGVQAAKLNYSTNILKQDFNSYAVFLKAGIPLHKFLALEARYGRGISKSEIKDTYYLQTPKEQTISAKLNTLIGIYFAASLPVNNKLSLTGLLGYSQVDGRVKYDIPESFDSILKSSGGPSIGIGLKYHIQPKVLLETEWTSYVSRKNNSSLGAVSGGLTYIF